ncbi:hypothetical protein SASPL_141041 [Salvia splendens]|uniref:Uncharacterized protein n=1 Tax=Salvia splendens TaxID=180675 RepID=A0A8X8WS65_SALSN|nr:hypothetical protein SASPL_141041 [Salvia splendens]
MSCSDGRVKGKAENIAGLTKEMALKRGHGKQPAVTKVVTNLNLRPPLTKKKGIVIAEAGTGGISADLHLKTAAGLVKGKEKVNKAKEAVRSEASNVETARVRKASPAMRSPFNERAVRLTAKANDNDKELYFWVLSTAETHESIWCVLFVLHFVVKRVILFNGCFCIASIKF